MGIIWEYVAGFLLWGFLWLVRGWMLYVYCVFLKRQVQWWESKDQPSPWRLYVKALGVSLLITAMLCLVTYGNKKGWNDGIDEDGNAHVLYDPAYRDVTLVEYAWDAWWVRVGVLIVLLSVGTVYQRHAPPLGDMAVVWKDPRLYIVLTAVALLVSYITSHELQYSSWDTLMQCYERRKEIGKEVGSYLRIREAHFRNIGSGVRIDESLTEFAAIEQTKKLLNKSGHDWMQKCFDVQFRFSADHHFVRNEKYNSWEFHRLEE